MPIETRQNAGETAVPSDPGTAFLVEVKQSLQSAVQKIQHCLDQLTDEQVQWRPHETHNSIQNILLHLCGNVRQWIIHGAGGAPDERNRPLEFSDRTPVPKAELLARLRAVVDDACRVLDQLPRDRLLVRRRIQGFDTYILAAIWDSASHFVGHTHQVVYITRLLVGDSYVFQFVPRTTEEGAGSPLDPA